MKAKSLLLEEVEVVKQLLAHSHLSQEVHKPLASADGAAEFRSTRLFVFEGHWGDALPRLMELNSHTSLSSGSFVYDGKKKADLFLLSSCDRIDV